MQSAEYLSSLRDHSTQTKTVGARIVSVNSVQNTATVSINSVGYAQDKQVELPMFSTPSGIGMRFVPFSDATEAHSIRILQDAGEYIPLGYRALNTPYMDNKDSTQSFNKIPLRYLNPGEVSIASGFNAEIYMGKNKGIHISDGQADSIVIDPVKSTIHINAANVKNELDGVRIRIGNVQRPVDPDSFDEVFIIKDGATQEKEFMVQVGTNVLDDGTDTDLPDVGFMGLGTRIFDEKGRFYKLKDDQAQFLVKTAGGGGIGISDKGDVYILDYKGGNTTVFNGGVTGEKWFRVGSNAISISETSGIVLSTGSESLIELPPDGSIAITESNGRGITIDKFGMTINVTEANLTLMAKDTTFIGGCSFGMAPTFGVLRGENVATAFDLHVHAGPGSPPLTPWTPMLQLSLLAMGLKVT